MSPLSPEEFWRLVLKAGTDPSQHVVAVLETKMQSQSAHKFAANFAGKDQPHLLRAETDQACQSLREATKREHCAATDQR